MINDKCSTLLIAHVSSLQLHEPPKYLKTFGPFNSNITSCLPLLVGGSSSCSPLLFPVFHSVAFGVMGFAGESRHILSCCLQKALSPHLIFRYLVDSLMHFSPPFFVLSPLCIPPLLQPDRQTITSGTCTICNVIATNVLPAKFLMKKKDEVPRR